MVLKGLPKTFKLFVVVVTQSDKLKHLVNLKFNCIISKTGEFILFCYFAPGRGDEYVCLSVCPSVRLHNSKTTWLIFTKFLHVAYVCGSVLLWQHCNMLCISGFVVNVTFSHNMANGPESSTTLLLIITYYCWRLRCARPIHTRGKVCYLQLPFVVC